MKNKNHKQNLRGFRFALTLLILAVFFVASESSFAFGGLVIGKVLYNPLGADNKSAETSYEMVEIKNVSVQPINISSWEIRMGTYYALSEIKAPVPANGTVVIFMGKGENKNADFSQGKIAYLYRNKESSQLPDTKGDISLYSSTTNNPSTIVDYVAYGKDFDFESSTNFSHASTSGLWKIGDVVPLAKESCLMEIITKNKGDSSDWSINCEAIDKKTEEDPAETTTIAIEEIKLGNITRDEHIYPKMFANFAVEKKDDEKVTWTFGDGHRSYKAVTKHKYDAVGTYAASVRVYKDKEEVVQNFTVMVEEYPRPKVKIIALNANPKGSDTKKETITIKNKTKEKINLKGWSVATGWKKFVNHPIREDFEIKPGKEKELTRDKCSFALVNSKDKVELRYPDGEVADEMKYKKGKDESVAEGEEYVKGKKGWKWVGGIESEKGQSAAKEDESPKAQSANLAEDTITKKQETNKIQEPITKNQTEQEIQNGEDIGDQIVDIRNMKVVILPENKIELAVAKIDSKSKVLGAQNVRESAGQYFFTPVVAQKHYAVAFVEKVLINVNSFVNDILNKMF